MKLNGGVFEVRSVHELDQNIITFSAEGWRLASSAGACSGKLCAPIKDRCRGYHYPDTCSEWSGRLGPRPGPKVGEVPWTRKLRRGAWRRPLLTRGGFRRQSCRFRLHAACHCLAPSGVFPGQNSNGSYRGEAVCGAWYVSCKSPNWVISRNVSFRPRS